MLFARQPGLGLIPDWQFSMDPAINPKINPHVKYPPGIDQTTVQPWGLGAIRRASRKDGCCDARPRPYGCNGCIDDFAQLRGPGLGMDNPFDSWGWQNRKLIAGGAVVVLGAAIVAGLAAVFK